MRLDPLRPPRTTGTIERGQVPIVLTVVKLLVVGATLTMGFGAASAFLGGQAVVGGGWLLLAFALMLLLAQLG